MSVLPSIRQTVYEYGHSQLVGTVRGEVIRHVNRKMEVATTVEASILAIDVDPRFVVDGSKVQVCTLASPVRRNIE